MRGVDARCRRTKTGTRAAIFAQNIAAHCALGYFWDAALGESRDAEYTAAGE